jgi:hypothetical protein
MGAYNHTASYVQWGTVPCAYIQVVYACAGSDDIDDGVHSADFVKMDLVDRNVVNLGLGVAKELECSDGSSLDWLI